MRTTGMTLPEKLAFYSASPDTNGCRIWTGAQNEGRAQLYWQGRSRKAHQLALQLKLGRPIKKGMGALHTCDNPLCIAEDHLYEGTQLRNIKDMFDRKRHSPPPVLAGITHGMAELTEKQVLEIRVARGVTQTKLAKKYRVTQALISSIQSRKLWKHLPPRPNDVQPRFKHVPKAIRRRIKRSKESTTDLVLKLGISRATIARIKKE